MSYKVEIARTGSRAAIFDVEGAANASEAVERAMQMAHDHDFGADSSADYTVESVTNSEGLKTYRLMLIESPGDQFDQTPILYECEAEDFNHAVEQAEDAYPACRVIGTEDGSILSEIELEGIGYEIRQEDNGWIWWYFPDGQLPTAPLSTKEAALRDATRRHREWEDFDFDHQIIAWLEQRVADGDLDIRDLCERAVRYGRMAPEDFIAEMKERLLAETCGSRVEYYVWHGEGECDNKTFNLEEARQWRDEFIAEGVGSYITDVDNNVIE